MRRTMTVFLLGVAIGAGTSCFDDESTLGLPCTDKASCGGGQDCIQGFCLKVGDSIFSKCGNGKTDRHEYCYSSIRQAVVAAPAARWIAMGDFNGDDRLDFVVMDTDEVDEDKIHIARYGDTGYPSVEVADTPDTPYMVGLAAGDISGDGLDDIVVMMDSPEYQIQISAYVNDGGGTSFTLVESFSTAMGLFTPPVVADTDGDGLADIVSVDSNNVRVAYWWKGLPGSMFANAVSIEAGRFLGRGPVVTHLKDDATEDVVYVETDGDLIAVLRGEEGDAPLLSDEIMVPERPTSVMPANLDDDSFGDLVVAHEDIAQVSLLIGKGTGDFEVLDPIDVPEGRVAHAGDMDGDGHVDLVSGGPSGLFLRPGFREFEFGVTLELGAGLTFNTRLVALEQADGDGVLDVVVIDRNSDGLSRAIVTFANP